MSKSKEPIPCADCGRTFSDAQKLEVHRKFKHPTHAPEPAGDAQGVHTAKPAPMGGGPAIDAPGMAQLGTDPEPETAPPPKQKPEVHELDERDERDYERTAAATMRGLDKVVSRVTGAPSSKEEVDDLLETTKPAAAYYGRRLGPLFLLVAMFIGWAAYAMAKMHTAKQQRRAQVGTPGPLSSDGTASRE